jgi:cation:H+ antiporter
MHFVIDSFYLIALFVLLGISAEFVVRNIKYLATVLKIRLFAFGILLGIITTLPELSVGINATLNGIASLSVGNLLGGVIVILGLVLGSSLLLNRKIVTDGNLKILIPQVAIIFLALFLGINGKYSLIDGLIMVGLYFGLIYYLYLANHSLGSESFAFIEKNKIIKAVFFSFVGVVAILLLSNWIVKITLGLLQNWQISKLLLGLLVFSVGTNLPEISIAITSWRKKSSELSLSHLLSSAFTNVLILGILAVIRPITVIIGPAFYVLAIFLATVLILFLFFYHSGKKMDRIEGAILLACYILFLFVNFWLIVD